MGFPFAAVAVLGAQARREDRPLVLVPLSEVQYAASTALLAVGRMRHRNLEAAIATRLAAARAHNDRWYAVGPLRMSEDREHIAYALRSATALDDDDWFLTDLPVRLLESAANDALHAPARRDAMVWLDKNVWSRLEVYARSRSPAAQPEDGPAPA